jgi:CDP-glycerol glycerophosphotransferase (TagB/SpsB family)
MDNVIWFFETVFLSFFSYLIPKDKSLILFWSMKGRYIWWNPKAFYLYLKYIHKFDWTLLYYYWAHSWWISWDVVTYWNTLKKYWLLLRAEYLFIDSCSFDLGVRWVIFWNFKLIQMWHGEPIKKIWFLSDLYISRRSKIVLFFEKLEYKGYKYVLSNYWSKDIIAGAFRNSNVLNIWLPRNDMLMNDSMLELYKNTWIGNQINLYKKTFSTVLLFSPTFRELNQEAYFSQENLKAFNQVLSETNTLCIIKLHPNEKRSFLSSNICSNIIDVTTILNFDSTDILPYVDWLITDYSSIYIDFLLTWKPIVWYQSDINEYIKSERWLLYLPDEVFIKESTAHTFNEFLSILWNIQSISLSTVYKQSYSTLRQKFYWNYWEWHSPCRELAKILFLKS